MSDSWVVAPSADRNHTLSDVARKAGVSTMTVSRVINGHAKVATATRERVLAVMAELNYRPNQLARGLASGRSHSIGVLTADAMFYGPRAALHSIEREAHAAGYAVSIRTIEDPDQVLDDAANMMRSGTCDGVVLVQPLIAGDGDDSGALQMPVVGVQAGAPGAFPLVMLDNRHGARLATQHLLGLGHATVWHVAGPSNWYEAAERIAGWQEALEAAGAPVPPFVRGDWSADSGYAAGKELLANPEVTAVFVGNDEMALGFLHAMHEHGLGCPSPISLVGFDDTPDSAHYSPGLTTIRQDFDAIGRRAVALLLQLMAGESVPRQRVALAPELIVRGSTAPPS